MESKQKGWLKKKAIGDQAETVVKFLIESTPDWQCVKYGVENQAVELKRMLKDNHENEISRKIKSMPDFIAINTKTKCVLFVESKYMSFIDNRQPGKSLFCFGYGQIKDYLDFWSNASLVVVHNHDPYFFVIDIKEVKWYKHFYGREGEGKTLRELWNFAGIQKNIKSLLPELTEENIKTAITMIPNKQ